MTNQFFSLAFGTDQDTAQSVRVPFADPLASGAEVKAVMNELVTGGMCGGKKGVFNKANAAAYTEQTTAEFDVA